MKQEHKLEELLEVWDNKEKAQAIQVLKKSMSENSEVKRVSDTVVKEYVKNTIMEGLDSGKMQDYPEDFSSTAKSPYYKIAIREVVKEVGEEFGVGRTSNTALQEAWKECEKSRTLIEFRRAFKMYLILLRSNFYTDEDIREYTELLDEQDKTIRELLEYKRIYNEMFNVLTSDDEELGQVLRAKRMKEQGMTDTEICKVLNVKRNKLNYIRKTIILEGKECLTFVE